MKCLYERNAAVGSDTTTAWVVVCVTMNGGGTVPLTALACADRLREAFGRAITTRLGFLALRSITFECRSKSKTSLVFSGLVMTRKLWTVTGVKEAIVAFTRGFVRCVDSRGRLSRSPIVAAQTVWIGAALVEAKKVAQQKRTVSEREKVPCPVRIRMSPHCEGGFKLFSDVLHLVKGLREARAVPTYRR